MKKFFGAEDAARFAAAITDEWQTEDGDIWDQETFIDVANCADGENPLDEEENEVYYIVDEKGAVGYTEDGGEDIYWWVTPTKITAAVPQNPAPAFCSNCGAKTEPGWVFCRKCGQKLS